MPSNQPPRPVDHTHKHLDESVLSASGTLEERLTAIEAAAGGGGGGGVTLRGPFHVDAVADVVPGIDDDAGTWVIPDIFTPTIGDVILDVLVHVSEEIDGDATNQDVNLRVGAMGTGSTEPKLNASPGMWYASNQGGSGGNNHAWSFIQFDVSYVDANPSSIRRSRLPYLVVAADPINILLTSSEPTAGGQLDFYFLMATPA